MAQVKVKAIKTGFYDNIVRNEGDVFLVDADLFSKEWMEKEAATPVLDNSQEAKKARRENAVAAIDDLGQALAGNPEAGAASVSGNQDADAATAANAAPASATGNSDLDGLSDDDLRKRYRDVIGDAAGNRKRETMIADITEKLNAD